MFDAALQLSSVHHFDAICLVLRTTTFFFKVLREQQPHIFAFVHLKPFASSAEPLRIVVMNMTEKETCTSITLLFSHKKPCAFPQIPKQGWAINLPKGSCEKLGPLGK